MGGMEPWLFMASGIVTLLTAVLAMCLPPAIKHKSKRRFFSGSLYVIAGMLVPLFIFMLSFFLVPEWKGGCEHGWIDCFIGGKITLMPLVLWGSAAFYVVQVLRPAERPHRTWVVLGILAGAIVSCTCFVYGLCFFLDEHEKALWLIVPGYTAVWYTILAVLTVRSSPLAPSKYAIASISSLPFWAASVLLSKLQFKSLPDQAPECFVVTAAMHGHRSIVGPLIEIATPDSTRRASRQLIIFWKLEQIWDEASPRTHRIFRRLYNRVGPMIARRIRSPFVADAVYLTLKPLEWVATVVISVRDK
jgi:hypothetical protein